MGSSLSLSCTSCNRMFRGISCIAAQLFPTGVACPAHFTGALYGVTILVALLGWAHSAAHKPDYADWFGLFRVPQSTSPDRASAHFYED